MTDETLVIADDAGLDISVFSPSTWQELFELVPVKVISSKLRWSSAEYNGATEFRPAFPDRGKKDGGPLGNSIKQWEFELQRFDAEYGLLDGTRTPVIIHAGVDLEKYSKGRDGQYAFRSAMLKGYTTKESTVISAWVKAVGSITDPSKLVDQMWMVKFFRQKDINGFPAKNVALPDHILPPTYQYTGEVQVFTVKPKDATVTDADVAVASTFGAGEPADLQALAEQVGAFVRSNGITSLDMAALSSAGFPAAARIEPFVSAFARGDEKAREVLAGFGVEV